MQLSNSVLKLFKYVHILCAPLDVFVRTLKKVFSAISTNAISRAPLIDMQVVKSLLQCKEKKASAILILRLFDSRHLRRQTDFESLCSKLIAFCPINLSDMFSKSH